eukprot:4272464-Pleurochrysis_carterae.AAC.1
MSDGVCPEGNWSPTRNQVGSSEFHDAAYGAPRNAIQLVDVWRASGSVNAFVGQELGELAGKEFTGIVALQGAHHSSRRFASLVEERREPGEEAPD